MQAGDCLFFGEYKWRVLDMQNDTVLIITERIIEQHAYHDINKETTWADCELRKYLNGKFYDKFTVEEKLRIISVINKNPNNSWYGATGGEDTKDNIFLLSIEEVVYKYFGDSSAKLQNKGKNQRYWFQGKPDANNDKRVAGGWWWLRSPGRLNTKAAYVHGDGNIGIQGNPFKGNSTHNGIPVCDPGGVRPALWLKI